MYVTGERFEMGKTRLSDIPPRYVKVIDMDIGHEITCIWADDSIGEYCKYIRVDGEIDIVKINDRLVCPRREICYGNIKIIDTRDEI